MKQSQIVQPASSAAPCSAAPSQTDDSQKRDWLRLVVMVENTDANRKIAGLLIADGRILAERFEGKKIVKAEALQVFGMITAKEKSPETKAQPNEKS
jgi:hypothetical protein